MNAKPMLAIDEAPALPMVKVCGALATPGAVFVKVKLDGVTLKTGGATPVPFRNTIWVWRASVIVSVPVSAPCCAGAKTTLMVQTAPAANCAPQLLVC